MTDRPKRNVIWPLLILALGAIALLQALEVFPSAVADLLGRAWPVILVLVGLSAALGEVRPLARWSWLIALAASALLLGGIIALAYTTRAASERDDNSVTFEQRVETGVERLRVTVETLQTDVEISPAVQDAPVIGGGFIGSTESVVDADYHIEGQAAVFTLRETQPNPIPALESIGRGRLSLDLPLGLPTDLDFRAADGTVSLNLLGLRVVGLRVNLASGELLLSLPDTVLETRGEVVVERGNVTVFVPENVGLHLFAVGAQPEFVGTEYVLRTSDNSWLPLNIDRFPVQTELSITARGGAIRVE